MGLRRIEVRVSSAAESVIATRLPGARVPTNHEEALIRDARTGSAQAAEELVRLYWPDAYRAAYLVLGDRAEAEDVAQESMIAALRALGRFRRGRPFRPWLHRIVMNRAIDASRAKQRRATPASPEMAALATGSRVDSADPDMVAAIASLPPDQRVVVVLRFNLGYGPEEIGALLGIPRGTVGSRLRRALDALRQQLEVAD